MFEYQLNVKLDHMETKDVEVRLWIDAELTGDLSSEREIALVCDGEASWSCLFAVEDPQLIYRIGICAQPGTTWSLSVCDAEHRERELLYDSDILTMAKEWLVGSYERTEDRDVDVAESQIRRHEPN